ncbi:hypothetical protein DVH24_035891 [Malus domestica]|uniref:Uncharacterized protein n=1 Tax=Malus domestica TaxID=3750 RepID=A0A498JTI2_MALDO|nr:hypothetical protein DVH24_035891 [Malus domestica]
MTHIYMEFKPGNWRSQVPSFVPRRNSKFIHGRIYVFQDPSGFVHQHLALSVGIDTKSYVGSLSFFSSHHRESTETQHPHLETHLFNLQRERETQMQLY